MKQAANIVENLNVNSIIDGSPTAIAILDRDLRIVVMNNALELLTGFSIEDARGIPCAYIIRNNLCAKACPARQALEQDKKVQVTGNIVNRARDLVPIAVTASPIKDRDGRTVGVLETIEDVSVKSDVFRRAPALEEFGELVGHSAAMEKIKAVLPVVAESDSSVLITGETGTGKDLVASIIHRLSSRSRGPFIKINCGALPESLLESELFGHVRGAFTGADRDKPGRFQLADGGTVYLTEIGDLYLPLQVKLLSFLDDKESMPLGGTRSVKTDVRVIAATHRDLEAMSSESAFRDDLLYRLKVVRIDLPPLRERGEDVVLLLEHFLAHFRRKFDKELEGFSGSCLDVLKHYPFPGNVRELRNIVEYAASICPSGRILRSHLPEYLGDQRGARGKPPGWEKHPKAAPSPSSLSMRAADADMDWPQMERVMINEALIQARGNRNRAAEILGWGRSTLWRKMKKHGLV